jgi:nonribosomal peptide synthetase CepB
MTGSAMTGGAMTGGAVAATLCQIFAGVLGLDQVHPGDAFFDAGGDSVLALQVIARAREAGLALKVRDLFDNQTPEALAAVAGDLAGDLAGTESAAAPAEPPLLAYSGDELAEFEDTGSDEGAGQPPGGTEAGWETVT